MNCERSPGLSCLGLDRDSQILSLPAEAETHTGQTEFYTQTVCTPCLADRRLSKWLSGDWEGQRGRDDILLPPHNLPCPLPQKSSVARVTMPQGHNLPCLLLQTQPRPQSVSCHQTSKANSCSLWPGSRRDPTYCDEELDEGLGW